MMKKQGVSLEYTVFVFLPVRVQLRIDHEDNCPSYYIVVTAIRKGLEGPNIHGL